MDKVDIYWFVSFISRRFNIRHTLNVAAGLDITREDQSIVEKKIELLDVPEQDIEQGRVTCLISILTNIDISSIN